MARPFLVVNPRSGSSRPGAEELAEAAAERGIEAHLLAGGEDAADLAREAAERGAPALGVAGGDGTIGSVAGVAVEAGVPFVCIPFGTRNHFARDLGLDADDPLGALGAFAGEERRVDVGGVDGRTFVNNVSLGLYASLVHDPRHRTKNRLVAAWRLLGAAFGRSRTPLEVSFDVDGRREHHRALVVLVGNNEYSLTSLAGPGVRERLDEGRLHAYVVEAASRARLAGLLFRAIVGAVERTEDWSEWAAEAFAVESRRRLHAAVDGDPVSLEPPVEFSLRPRALRVLLPTPSRDPDAGRGGRQ